MDSERPSLKWDDSFEISISTNDLGLNLTETIYYVSKIKLEGKGYCEIYMGAITPNS
jgi:hypothetical protein